LSHFGHSRKLTEGTSGRLVELLRRGPATIDDLAEALGVTRTAVRAQLTVLMGQGVVELRGFRKGPSKPARMFGVTVAAEERLSRAYIPVLVALLGVLARRMEPGELDDVMQEVGRKLHLKAVGTLAHRVEAANELLRTLGALTSVNAEPDGYVIEGQGGCPLGAATSRFPQACSVITSIVSEMVGQPVANCCEEHERRRCCFRISAGAA
jgi:DeoR family transcriptional regulator, suf operon transcriptional repressor